MIASLPFHKYIWVDSSFIRTDGTGFESAVWFGLVSQYGRAWGLNVLLECGAIYRSLPPHAIAFNKTPEPWTVNDAQVWDCYSDKFSLHEYSYLREARVARRELRQKRSRVFTYSLQHLSTMRLHASQNSKKSSVSLS